MGWQVTGDVDEFLAEAGGYLRSRLAENTVLLTAAENVRVGVAQGAGPSQGRAAAGGAAPLFGWWRPDGAAREIAGAFIHTPPWPAALSAVPAGAAAALATGLAAAGREVPGVNGAPRAAAAFADAWQRSTGAGSEVHRHMRLYRLAGLAPPVPSPAGAARTASLGDRPLLLEWQDAFRAEVNDLVNSGSAAVDDRLSYGGFQLWEVDRVAVSLAGASRVVADMVRVGPVYTPPGLRGRGYAGAVTAAVSRAALAAGAREVVLFTDLANPTSNALYQRIGYRPVSDRVVLSFRPAGGRPGALDLA
jgi:GNAT superfamily N-acetyltransferase